MSLGALMMEMHSKGILLPKPAAPFPGIRLCELEEKKYVLSEIQLIVRFLDISRVIIPRSFCLICCQSNRIAPKAGWNCCHLTFNFRLSAHLSPIRKEGLWRTKLSDLLYGVQFSKKELNGKTSAILQGP